MRDKPSHRVWKLLVRLIMFIAVIWFIVSHLNIADVAHAFGRLKPGYLVPILVVLTPLAVALRALRWRCLLPGGESAPLSGYVGAYLIGTLANSVLFGKFGDLVKARVICDSQIDYGRSLAVVVIDRLLEALALVLVFAAVLLNSTLPRWAYHVAWVAGLASVAGLAGLRLLFHHRDWFLRLAERLLSWLPAFRGPLVTFVQRLLAGCAALADYRRVLRGSVYALAVWVVEIATMVLFLSAFSISAPWLVASVVLIAALNFGMLLPVSPGSVGIYQLICGFVLSLWGVDREVGFTLGIVMQVVNFMPLYLAGLMWMLLMKWNKEKNAPAAVLGQIPGRGTT